MIDSADPGRPVLRIVNGDAGPDHVAALLAVLAAAGSGAGGAAGNAAQPAGGVGPGWADPAGAFRGPVRVCPGSWRASGWGAGVRTRAAW
ncbi:MAG TPA: acyl-CoA carboxylase epsilon subunit [Mycobacteriales bacterium]|nr:acyl-CoA carboxylase epsilon subunit [Mycobacteriales bacterium]